MSKENCPQGVNYLRVSVTDRCDLRCLYCMPSEGVPLSTHEGLLRFEEIETLVRCAADLGVRKVRLTGGEPLLRRGIADLIDLIRDIPSIDDIALTTNGRHLEKMVDELKAAGLNRVNISLDTLNPERYRDICRGADFDLAWRGVEAALRKGLHPVKLNMVVMAGINDDEITEMANLTLEYPLHVRFIELMPFGPRASWALDHIFSLQQIRERINGWRPLEPAKLQGEGPARYYRVPGAPGTIGFISAVREHLCQSCNRLRLTSEGMLRPCLHSPYEVDLRTPLRSGASPEEIRGLMAGVISAKPEYRAGRGEGGTSMSRIGG